VIDARDLKFHRPVCGFTFKDEDNAFAWRGRIKFAQAGLAEVAVALFVGAAIMAALITAAVLTQHWGYWVAAALGGLTWFQAIWFFRDPNRTIPTGDESALLSPSDGVVTDIEELDDPEFPSEMAFRLSIYLSPLDVHLNRNPRDARVEAVRYFPGRFLTASHYECAVQNEQLWVDLREDNGRLIRVKQISGSMARRLVCWLKEGEAVKAGERYGLIKYGSRADIILSASESMDLKVKVGDRVYAGTTVLLRFTGEEKA
jgi:phosphatidylserine decarboxylase